MSVETYTLVYARKNARLSLFLVVKYALSLYKERVLKTKQLDGKPIQLRPPRELRKKLEEEAQRQNRSLNNLIIVLLTRVFRSQNEAGHE